MSDYTPSKQLRWQEHDEARRERIERYADELDYHTNTQDVWRSRRPEQPAHDDWENDNGDIESEITDEGEAEQAKNFDLWQG